LTTDVERRFAALTTSTPSNEFQHLIFSVPVSEANASGMVSNLILLHRRFHRHSFWHLRERIVFSFRGVVSVPGVPIFCPKRFSYDWPIQSFTVCFHG